MSTPVESQQDPRTEYVKGKPEVIASFDITPTTEYAEVKPLDKGSDIIFTHVREGDALQVDSIQYWKRLENIKNVFNNSTTSSLKLYTGKYAQHYHKKWSGVELNNLYTREIPVCLPDDTKSFNGTITVVLSESDVKSEHDIPVGVSYNRHFCKSARFSSPEDFSKISKLELIVGSSLFDTIYDWQVPILQKVYGIDNPNVIPFGFCAPNQKIPMTSYHPIEVKIHYKDAIDIPSTTIIAEYGELEVVSRESVMLEYMTSMVTGTDVNPSVTFKDNGYLERHIYGRVLVTHLLININGLPLDKFHIHFQTGSNREDQFSMKLHIDPATLTKIGDFYVVPLCESIYDGVSFSTASNTSMVIDAKEGQSMVQIFTISANVVRCMNHMIALAFSS